MKRNTPAKSGMGRDILATTVTSVAVLGANLVVSAILARAGAVEVFGAFNLVKRLAASALPLLTLGLTVGVVKHVASTDHPEERSAQQLSALGLVLGVIAVVSVGLLLAPQLAIKLLLGDGTTFQLWALWAYTIALCLNAMVFSFYRAELRQMRANLTNMFAYAVVPIMVALLMPAGANGFWYALAVATLVLVINCTELLVRVVRLRRPTTDALKAASRDLLAYSVPRIPSGVAIALLLVFSPWYANRQGNPLVATYLLAALALAQMMSASLQAFGIVLLPRVSVLSADGDLVELRALTEKLTVGALVPSLCAVPFLIAFATPLVGIWLGATMLPATLGVVVVAVALPAVSLYNVQRSIADGLIRAPVNTYAAVAGLALCVGISVSVPSVSLVALSGAYAAGQWVVALVLLVTLWRALGLRLPWPYILLCCVAALTVAFGAAYATSELAVWFQLMIGVGLGLATVAGCLWFAPRDLGLGRALGSALGLGGSR